jgi:uncharacterized protein YheU (UPF0270 family)
MSDDVARAEGVVVPWQQLAPETLRRLIEEYVTREGTEYGEAAVSLEEKCSDVMRQLRRGEALVTFDPVTESVDIVPSRRR